MAYGLKYYHDYCDLEGKPERIAILENGYEGLAQAIRAAPKPFQVSYESGSDFKFDPIRPSKATITLLYELDFQFSEIWTADERTFKIDKYHDGELDWTGFVIPNGFRRLLIAGKKHIQVDAADGLSTLQSIPFLNTDGQTYGTQDLVYNDGLWFPFSLIATEILRKLDLDINTWIAVDVYEQSMSKVGDREADPLSQSLVNVKTYINDRTQENIKYWRDAGAVWDCKRVLTNLLYIWGAKIYQEGAVWRIKRVNIDANKADKEWRIYNTLNVFIGKDALEPDLTIPCQSIWDVLPGLDHVINMDRVFDAVRINYTYSYERDAKESENMISNGDFAEQGSVSPIDWIAWGKGDNPPIHFYYVTEMNSGINTDGITTAVAITSGADQRRELQYANDIPVNVGDKFYLEWWERIDNGGFGINWNSVYTIYIETDPERSGGREPSITSNTYFLGNNGINRTVNRGGEPNTTTALGAQWVDERVYFFGFASLLVREERMIENNRWVKISVDVPTIPDNGTLRFRIHGAVEFNPIAQFRFRKDPFPGYFPTSNDSWTLEEYYYTGPNVRELAVTGIFFGVAKGKGGSGGGENEVLPSDHDYTVFNDGIYSDRFEPLEIFNGDANDPNHVSRIRVLTAEPERQLWNTSEGIYYESSSLGLITAYSIMNQYNRPYKMLEGTFALRGIKFGSVVTLTSLPGEKFIVQRGTFTDYDRYGNFQGTLVQIAPNQVIENGYDNGNNTDPQWVGTGRVRCQKSSRGGVQTGYVETEEVNINPNSDAVNRWVLSEEQDLIACPLGEPSLYWFGADGVVLDTDVLEYFPVDVVENEVTVRFTNTGGLYLYFLHAVELGVVERIYTPTQSDIIRDWQYFDDAVIGGYTYRVLRMNHETGIFKNGVMTFVFNL